MKLRLEWFYQVPKQKQSYFMKSDWIAIEEALIVAEDLEKTGRIKNLVFYDSFDTTWTKKELIRFLKERETEPHDLVAYFDGGYHKSSKLAGLGVAIYYRQHHQKWRQRHNQMIEYVEDNNEAEYAALAFLLNKLEELEVRQQPITLRSDSMTVINQLSGEWPCYEETYIPWFERIETKLSELQLTAHYELINRSKNKEADQLATQALQGVQISSKREQL